MSPLSGNRSPAVSGTFYPGERKLLFEEIHRCFTHYLGPGVFPNSKNRSSRPHSSVLGCYVMPHAGYMYSGPIAAHSYLKLSEKISNEGKGDLVAIIIGPNHYGIGSGIALSQSETWETPLGRVRLSPKITNRIVESSNIIDIDGMSHAKEHSIEVQLPFLQVISEQRKKELRIVPISLMLQDRETTEEVSRAILSSIKDSSDDFIILGSSDLTHYEPQERANSKDMRLLDAIKSVDVLEFYKVLERTNVSACGYGAISCAMHVASALGLKLGNLLKYATSGDITGDYHSVVGYSAVEFI